MSFCFWCWNYYSTVARYDDAVAMNKIHIKMHPRNVAVDMHSRWTNQTGSRAQLAIGTIHIPTTAHAHNMKFNIVHVVSSSVVPTQQTYHSLVLIQNYFYTLVVVLFRFAFFFFLKCLVTDVKFKARYELAVGIMKKNGS